LPFSLLQATLQGPWQNISKNFGYGVVAIVWPTTDAAAIAQIADRVIAGNINQEFMNDKTKGCVDILNFLAHLMPRQET
jgi:hypothetical protein